MLVNDLAAVNIDHVLLADKVERVSEQMVALTNGCICCTIREDLVREIRRMAEQQAFDALVVESTGVSLPMPVAASFDYVDPDSSHGHAASSLSDVARLDTTVTVVDASTFLTSVQEAASLRESDICEVEGVGPDDDRTVADLLVEQVEFADTLVINKCDLVSGEQLERLSALLARLNPLAVQVRSTRGRVPVDQVLQTGEFQRQPLSEGRGQWAARGHSRQLLPGCASLLGCPPQPQFQRISACLFPA